MEILPVELVHGWFSLRRAVPPAGARAPAGGRITTQPPLANDLRRAALAERARPPDLPLTDRCARLPAGAEP